MIKYQSFITKLLSLVLICGVLYHYQSIAAARAAVAAENAAAVAEAEAYNREIAAENQRREAAAAGESGAAGSETGAETASVYKDGTYEGTGTGYGGPITVSVTIESDVITTFEVLSHDGEDPAYYSQAEALTETVLQQQSTEVDTISGATFSSRGILEALNDAVDKAVNG